MKITIPQFIETKALKAIQAVKRKAANGLNYVSNVFERSPNSDIYETSFKFSKKGISETEKNYISIVNNVPVAGVFKKEQPILNLVQESMFQMLKVTNGKSTPFNKILFAHDKNPQILASVYYPANVLFVNKSYLENIDGLIDTNIQVFDIVRWITKDKDGKYKILDLLRNPKSEEFEKQLNEYNPKWSLKDKFIFDSLGTYYRNLASQAFYKPENTIEKIFQNEENCKILKENGLYEKRKDVFPLKSFQEDYLIEIGEFCHLPEDTCLTTYPEIVFNHEYIHKWCFDNFSEEYLAELHSKPVQQNWENDKQIQLIANKVSFRATEEPMEYIAEVGSGLAGGQKFDQDIMALYESLKGPKL